MIDGMICIKTIRDNLSDRCSGIGFSCPRTSSSLALIFNMSGIGLLIGS